MSDLFLVKGKVEYDNLELGENCFNSGDIVASLSPQHLTTVQGSPNFAERK